MARKAAAKVEAPVVEAPVAPVAGPQITQEDLLKYETTEAELKRLGALYDAAKLVHTQVHDNIVAKLKAKGTVEPGEYTTFFRYEKGKCTPSWKTEAILLALAAGRKEAEYEAEVKAKYPAGQVEKLFVGKIHG